MTTQPHTVVYMAGAHQTPAGRAPRPLMMGGKLPADLLFRGHITALSGPAGVGKTALAVALAAAATVPLPRPTDAKAALRLREVAGYSNDVHEPRRVLVCATEPDAWLARLAGAGADMVSITVASGAASTLGLRSADLLIIDDGADFDRFGLQAYSASNNAGVLFVSREPIPAAVTLTLAAGLGGTGARLAATSRIGPPPAARNITLTAGIARL